jgi:hypothetical protein
MANEPHEVQIAVMKVQMDEVKKQMNVTVSRIEAVAADMKSDREDFHKAVTDLSAEMTRYKGFVGGITFVIGAMLTAFTVFKSWLLGDKA